MTSSLIDIYTLLSRLSCELASVNRVPTIVGYWLTIIGYCFNLRGLSGIVKVSVTASPLFTTSGSLTNVPADSVRSIGEPLTVTEAEVHHVGIRSVRGSEAPSAPFTVNVSVSENG